VLAHADLDSFALGEQPGPGYGYEPPPLSNELHILSTADEVRAATNQIAGNARRLISICTPDMEPAIYDQPAFLETMKRFVLGRAFGKVRVLVRDSARMNASNNRFVSMARRLTNYLEIRLAPPEMHQQTAAYCIADDRAVIYRLRADRWDGVSSLNNPPAAQHFLQQFDAGWIGSSTNQQQRVSNG
jgi:hypothetical protein